MKIVIVGKGICANAHTVTDGARALVMNAADAVASQQYAQCLQVPLVETTTVFRLSPQTVRVSATRRVIAPLPPSLFTALSPECLQGCNCVSLRGIPPELATAALLARVYQVSNVEWCYPERGEAPTLTGRAAELLLGWGLSFHPRPIS